MAAGGTEYTVFGYGSGFDGRPTVFLTAFPPTRVCSACGLVSSIAGFLPCRHVLCNRCYDRCLKEEISECPLDRHIFQSEDVVCSTFSKDSILDRKIQCWNAKNGCAAVGPASEMLKHFNDDCLYYAATCQRCSRTVTQKDAFDHVMSGDCVQEQLQTPPTPEGVGAVSFLESLQSLDNRLTEGTRLILDAIKDVREAQISMERNMSAVIQFSREEIDGLRGQLESTVRSVCRENTERVLASCANIRTATDALKTTSLESKKDMGQALKALEKSINRRSGIEEQLLGMRKEFDHKLSAVLTATKAILGDKLNSSEPLEWTIDGWSKLKDAEKRADEAVHYAKQPGYFYGYSILPGAQITDIDGTPSLRLVFHICKGIYDELLTWPIAKEFHFKVLHPVDKGNVRCQVSKCHNKNMESLKMPTAPRSERLFATGGIPIKTLEANGYVKNDKILARIEVFP